jgi:hypothetical protein
MKTHDKIGAVLESVAESDRYEQQIALEYVAEAWTQAEDDGIESLALAHASLFAALAALVTRHGERITAELVATLPDRVRAGEYTLNRTVQ